MAVLDRADLEASSLADLHSIAGQIGLDGFRRLRKVELVELILARRGDEGASGASDGAADEPDPAAGTRRRRSPRRARSADPGAEDAPAEEADAEDAPAGEPREPSSRRTRSGRSAGRAAGRSTAGSGTAGSGTAGRRRGRGAGEAGDADETSAAEDEQQSGDSAQATVAGEVEVLGNGSAFLRVSPPGSSDDDVYVSAAQVRRCELVSGDKVSGPVRRPRRSERYPSLARVDTINGEPADGSARTVKYDSLPASFPSERFELPGDDATLAAIARYTPIGRGSRVAIVGAARAGKTETLRRLVGALAAAEGVETTLLLLGARPEELGEWEQGTTAPAAALSFAASADAQGQALEHEIETAKRLASHGGNAVIAIDSLDGVHPHVARRALAAAKNIEGSGSLTVIATAARPFGGESTVIALDATRTATLTLPALDLPQSGTLRPELLVGQDGAAEIVKARLAPIG